MFFFIYIYVSWYIYCYTDTTNFIIFPQLLTCQFLTSQNKIIKYETDQSQLKINVLRKCYNTYCAVLLVYSTGTVATVPKVFFFLVIGLIFFLYIYVSWYIYYYTDTTNFTIFSQLFTC